MKHDNENSALRRLKFDTVGEDVAVAPEQSAGVYGATGRESPLAPLALSRIHICRCRRSTLCRCRWSPFH